LFSGAVVLVAESLSWLTIRALFAASHQFELGLVLEEDGHPRTGKTSICKRTESSEVTQGLNAELIKVLRLLGRANEGLAPIDSSFIYMASDKDKYTTGPSSAVDG
jgi:hypothetical protein